MTGVQTCALPICFPVTIQDIGTWEIEETTITIKTNKIPEGETWYIRSIQTINRITLENYPLENLETIRDKILLTAGDITFDISDTEKKCRTITIIIITTAIITVITITTSVIANATRNLLR